MAKSNNSPPEVDCNLAHLLVDDVFRAHLLRTEEGLTIEGFEHQRELLASLGIETPRSVEA